MLRANDPAFGPAIDAGYFDTDTLNSVIEQSKPSPLVVDVVGLAESDLGDVAAVKSGSVRENLDVQGFKIYPGDEISFVIFENAGGSGSASIQGNFKELH